MTGISICQALDLKLAQGGAKEVPAAQKTRESRTGGNIGSEDQQIKRPTPGSGSVLLSSQSYK